MKEFGKFQRVFQAKRKLPIYNNEKETVKNHWKAEQGPGSCPCLTPADSLYSNTDKQAAVVITTMQTEDKGTHCCQIKRYSMNGCTQSRCWWFFTEQDIPDVSGCEFSNKVTLL